MLTKLRRCYTVLQGKLLIHYAGIIHCIAVALLHKLKCTPSDSSKSALTVELSIYYLERVSHLLIPWRMYDQSRKKGESVLCKDMR